MTHLRQLTNRTNQVITAKQHTWLRTQLTTYDILIQTIVTIDDNPVDRRLRSLLDTDLQGDRVVLDLHLNRIGVEEEVTVIEIDVRHRVLVRTQTLCQFLLVIDLTRLHAQDGSQIIGRVLRITDKPDILQEILLSLNDLQEDIHLLLIVVHHTIRNQDGVAVTELIILRDQVLLIVLILLGRELLGAEHLEDTGFPVVIEAELLVRLLHRLLQRAGGQFLITLEIDPVDLCLLVLVDIDIDNHLTLVRGIILLLNIDLDILKALIIEETLDDRLRTVHHVRCNLITLPQSETSLQILTFAFLDTRIMHLRYTGPLFQLYFQPDLITLNLRGQDLDI